MLYVLVRTSTLQLFTLRGEFIVKTTKKKLCKTISYPILFVFLHALQYFKLYNLKDAKP